MPTPFVYTGEDGDAVPTDAKHVIIDSSVRVIPNKAFYGYTELEEVELMVGVQVIGERAFQGCVSLSRIELPEWLEEIENRAFYECRVLERVHFPTSLLSIGPQPLLYAGNLLVLSYLMESRRLESVHLGIVILWKNSQYLHW